MRTQHRRCHPGLGGVHAIDQVWDAAKIWLWLACDFAYPWLPRTS